MKQPLKLTMQTLDLKFQGFKKTIKGAKAPNADMAQLERSGAHPVDEEANTEVLGFNKHQTFMVLGRRLKQEEDLWSIN